MSEEPERIDLYNCDCRDGMEEKIDEKSVDLVVTSPPYNLGIDYNAYDDSSSRESYLKWMEDWAKQVKKVLKDDGSLFLNLGSKPSDPWVPHEVLMQLRDYFELQNEIHWIKSITVEDEEKTVSAGHYKPVNSDRFINQCHEYIFHLTKDGTVPLERLEIGVPYKDKSNIERWDSAGEDLRCRGNTWFIPYETITDSASDRPHPASFPSRLAEMAMRLHGVDKIDLALDPFLGIGSSALAAEKLKLNFAGFEIDEQYLDVARKRLDKFQRKLF
ncbi:MAG: DNA-methyltransferase [bacterium]